jgi:hypothetical protein
MGWRAGRDGEVLDFLVCASGCRREWEGKAILAEPLSRHT